MFYQVKFNLFYIYFIYWRTMANVWQHEHKYYKIQITIVCAIWFLLGCGFKLAISITMDWMVAVNMLDFTAGTSNSSLETGSVCILTYEQISAHINRQISAHISDNLNNERAGFSEESYCSTTWSFTQLVCHK